MIANQIGKFWTEERNNALREAIARTSSDIEAGELLTTWFGVVVSRQSVKCQRNRLGIHRTSVTPFVYGSQFSSSPPAPPTPAPKAVTRSPFSRIEPDPFPSQRSATPHNVSAGQHSGDVGVRFTEPKMRIPATCAKHPKYEGIGRPVGRDGPPCESCMDVWRFVQSQTPDVDVHAETIAKLVDMTRRKALSLEEVCNGLDVSPAKARSLVEMAKQRGFRVEVDGSHVGRRPQEDSTPGHQDVAVSAAGDRHVVAVVGDVHYGSKFHLGAYFADYCKHAYERGARTFLQVGDLLDGVYRHSIWDQSRRGYEEQVDEAIECLPRMPGAEWWFIQGNHDETLGEANGLDVGRAIEQSFVAAGRKDLHYLGARGAYVRLVAPGDRRGFFAELWHPRDRGNAYAKSYRIQKHIEKYAPGQKPDFLAVGHWHQQMYFTTRGVHAMSVGCWQGGASAFGKSLGGAPDIGSWIVEYALTSEGTVRHIRPEWVGYFEKETVRDVELG